MNAPEIKAVLGMTADTIGKDLGYEAAADSKPESACPEWLRVYRAFHQDNFGKGKAA